jgi:hypothetical protein
MANACVSKRPAQQPYVARIVALKLPTVVGVPVIVPVDVLSVSPGGSAPTEMLYTMRPADSHVALKFPPAYTTPV